MINKKDKAVLTVVGHDRVGIIAAVANILSDYHVNIEDISQTILQDIFNMIMMVDLTSMERPIEELRAELERLGEKMGLNIMIQHSALFDSMHRI